MFSNKDLKNLIIPLFLEQLLTILVGLADTFVISFVSEAAVSGVSLVNSFNTIFIFLFTALASGGAGLCDDGAGVYHRDRAVYGCGGYRTGGAFCRSLGKGLRAAGDVKFTVVWSIVTTIGVRLLASVLLAIVFDMGVIGIALAMSFDWCVRAVAFYIRFRGGKWKKYQLIQSGMEDEHEYFSD